MFATLGSLSFDVLGSPTKWQTEKKYKYEPIYVIGAPPVLQWIYDDLRHIQWSIYMHQMWMDPQSGIQDLVQLAETHQPQALVLGNGQNLGQFVVSQQRLRQVWQADDGTPIAAEMEIELTEYVAPASTSASSSTGNIATTAGAAASPPGLTSSQVSSAPGASLVQSPATASPSGIPPQNPYTDVPPSTIARGY